MQDRLTVGVMAHRVDTPIRHRTALSIADIEAWVVQLNEVFAPAGVCFALQDGGFVALDEARLQTLLDARMITPDGLSVLTQIPTFKAGSLNLFFAKAVRPCAHSATLAALMDEQTVTPARCRSACQLVAQLLKVPALAKDSVPADRLAVIGGTGQTLSDEEIDKVRTTADRLSGPQTFATLFSDHVAMSIFKQMALSDLLGEPRRGSVDVACGTVDYGEGRVYPIQILGTASDQRGTWRWSWSDSVPPDLAVAAGAMRDLGRRHGIDALTQPELSLEINPEVLGIMASGACGTSAYDRAQGEDGTLFFLLDTGEATIFPPIDVGTLFTTIVSEYDVDAPRMIRAFFQYNGWPVYEQGRRLGCHLPNGHQIIATFDAHQRLERVQVGSGDTALLEPPIPGISQDLDRYVQEVEAAVQATVQSLETPRRHQVTLDIHPEGEVKLSLAMHPSFETQLLQGLQERLQRLAPLDTPMPVRFTLDL